jgi:predicted dehydrogenase
MIDLIIWLLKEKPTHIQAVSNKVGSSKKMINSETFSSLNLFFNNGCIANINAHGLSAHPHFHSLKIYGDKASFIQEYKGAYMFKYPNINKNHSIKSKYPFKENRNHIIDQFICYLSNKKINDSFVSFNEIVKVMSICFSAIDSNTLNKKIKIKYF